MEDNTNNQPNSQNPVPAPDIYPSGEPNQISDPNGKRVIQPSDSFRQELQAQQQTSQPATPEEQNLQPEAAPIGTPINVAPAYATINARQAELASSQNQQDEPKKGIDALTTKSPIVRVLIGLGVGLGIFAILVVTNTIALTEFKSLGYKNSMNTVYKLDFYTKHGSITQSGNTVLVSRVSKDDKFPVTLSISSGEISGYNRVKDCTNFIKVFDVENENVDQTISVCNVLSSEAATNGVYLAGFTYNDQAHIITISQDLSSVDVSSKSKADESLTRFGLDPYNEDIKKIVASITVTED